MKSELETLLARLIYDVFEDYWRGAPAMIVLMPD